LPWRNQKDLKWIFLSIDPRRHTFYILGGKEGAPRYGVMAAEKWRGPECADEEQRTVITTSIPSCIDCDPLTLTGITRDCPEMRHASDGDSNCGAHPKFRALFGNGKSSGPETSSKTDCIEMWI
jgi:hypothetical protein